MAATSGGIQLVVNPLSQHAYHCFQQNYYTLACFITLRNAGRTGVYWFGENQYQSSGNYNESSTLYANGQSGGNVSGYLPPGQQTTVEILTEDCYLGNGQYWTFLFGSSTQSNTLAPQASILQCY